MLRLFCRIQGFAFPNATRKDEERMIALYRTLDEAAPPFSEEEETKHLALFPEKSDTWYSGDQLESLLNFGPTLEWIVQAVLQREYHALARRHVSLSGLGQLGDIDVLAFLEDGRTMMVECKSSTRGITNGHIERFLKRTSVFTSADVALLLIDSDDPSQMQQRHNQLCRSVLMKYGEYNVGHFLSWAVATYTICEITCMLPILGVASSPPWGHHNIDTTGESLKRRRGAMLPA